MSSKLTLVQFIKWQHSCLIFHILRLKIKIIEIKLLKHFSVDKVVHQATYQQAGSHWCLHCYAFSVATKWMCSMRYIWNIEQYRTWKCWTKWKKKWRTSKWLIINYLVSNKLYGIKYTCTQGVINVLISLLFG